ncbi:diaminopimelate epimerase [Clostridium sp. 'deep sea']|uniref:diaminopimelate epimerase n=1 Tax=Clostridium sp. 'deep sea' TaxID=2779445 RepID=UPI001896671E|nr:diaminopimelate epimerase [Clostridium sp. 'deep sea']QOR33700.1 diaminopimelate epimerase [Clostridium sp. 'deep sea']
MSEKKELKFVKYQGLGNDFIFFEQEQVLNLNYNELAQKVCNRNFGIGADGMAVLSKASDIKMEFFNADGGEAPMCGNASRCIAHYVTEQQIINKKTFTLQTAGGDLHMNINKNNSITANLGQPLLSPKQIPALSDKQDLLNIPLQLNDTKLNISVLNTMTPHTVIFVESLANINIAKIGSQIENHNMFPQKINANFVEIINKNEVKQITWERGVGQTLACGTGACASVVAGVLTGKLNNEVLVTMHGGLLTIQYSKEKGILMTGAVNKIASGIYYY